MAGHHSALKRVRQNEKRRRRNMSATSRLKTLTKKTLAAVAAADATLAERLLAQSAPAYQRAAAKGIIPTNTAARHVARLTRRVRALTRPAPVLPPA